MRPNLSIVLDSALAALFALFGLGSVLASDSLLYLPVKGGLEASGPAGLAGVPVPGLRRVFKAGFEEPVSVVTDPTGASARLKGVDDNGMSWDELDHVFRLVAPDSFNNLVTIGFSRDRVFAGSRSLFLRQNKVQDGTQVRLQFYGDDKVFGDEIFTRRHYFIPSRNLAYLAREHEGASIAGTRELRAGKDVPDGSAGTDFTMPLYVVRRGNRLVFKQVIADYSAGPNWSSWTRLPKGLKTYGRPWTTVPLDRWFQLDIYVLRNPTKGKIKVWLDNKLIFDLENVRTKNDTDRWFTKIADIDSRQAPFELWVDDVEIWSR